jgi:hypothetical protein
MGIAVPVLAAAALAAAPSPSPPLAAGPVPPPLVALGDVTSVPAQAGLVTVPGTSAVVGSGPVRRFAVDVERGVRVDPDAFASAVERILLDPHGWTGGGRLALQRVDSGVVDVRVTLARPRTVDRLCFPLHTAGFADCFNRGRAVINVDRWTQGSVSYVRDLRDYRYYLINHEVGHGLGHGHKQCPGPGRRSFVMMQQTGTTFGCRRQPWPRVSEQRTPLDPPRVLVVSDSADAAGFFQALGAPDDRLDVRAAPLSAAALGGVAAVVFVDGAAAPAAASPPLPAPPARRALQRFVRRGGGVLALGSAATDHPGWRFWQRLVGGSRCHRSNAARVVVDGAAPPWTTAEQQTFVAGGLAWVLGLSERRPCG